jgi:hypothetical protein
MLWKRKKTLFRRQGAVQYPAFDIWQTAKDCDRIACRELNTLKLEIWVGQASATYGTRAKRGTWNDFQWHAE